MSKTRAVAVVIHNNCLLVMYRKNNREFYVFPGGGVESGEEPEDAVIREVYEEASIVAELDKFLFKLYAPEDDTHMYYLCKYVSGEPMLQTGTNEYNDVQAGTDYFKPLWLQINEINNTVLYPNIAKKLVLEHLEGKDVTSGSPYLHD